MQACGRSRHTIQPYSNRHMTYRHNLFLVLSGEVSPDNKRENKMTTQQVFPLSCCSRSGQYQQLLVRKNCKCFSRKRSNKDGNVKQHSFNATFSHQAAKRSRRTEEKCNMPSFIPFLSSCVFQFCFRFFTLTYRSQTKTSGSSKKKQFSWILIVNMEDFIQRNPEETRSCGRSD